MVDASVAVKWIVAEDGRQSALALPDVAELVAPDFVVIETANVLWKKLRRDEITTLQLTKGLNFIRSAFSELVPQSTLIDRAMQLAIEHDHPVYDCLYVACAELRHAELLTADDRMASRFEGQSVRRLGTLS